MPSGTEDAYAKPVGRGWGDWVPLYALLGGGPWRITVRARTKSDAPSSFDGELSYIDESGTPQKKRFFNYVSVVTEAGTAHEPKVRFKSHSMGQYIEVDFTVGGVSR